MAAWLAVYRFGLAIDFAGLSPSQWHAHEMVFGFAMAVIAGFLLTAAWNWTDRETASGGAAGSAVRRLGDGPRPDAARHRVAVVCRSPPTWCSCSAWPFAIARPILKVRQKRQAPVLLIAHPADRGQPVFLPGRGRLDSAGRASMASTAACTWCWAWCCSWARGSFPSSPSGAWATRWSSSRRRWNDIATFALYPLFLLSEVLLPHHFLGAVLAAALLALNSVRVSGWYTLGIWQKPLLWGLFAAFMMINLGFLLRALMPVTAIPDFLADPRLSPSVESAS